MKNDDSPGPVTACLVDGFRGNAQDTAKMKAQCALGGCERCQDQTNLLVDGYAGENRCSETSVPISEIKEVNLKKGTVLMVQIPERYASDRELVGRIIDELQEAFPDNKCMVFPFPVSFGAMNPEGEVTERVCLGRWGDDE